MCLRINNTIIIFLTLRISQCRKRGSRYTLIFNQSDHIVINYRVKQYSVPVKRLQSEIIYKLAKLREAKLIHVYNSESGWAAIAQNYESRHVVRPNFCNYGSYAAAPLLTSVVLIVLVGQKERLPHRN